MQCSLSNSAPMKCLFSNWTSSWTLVEVARQFKLHQESHSLAHDLSNRLGDINITGPKIRSLLNFRGEYGRAKPPEFVKEMMLDWSSLLSSILKPILPSAQCQDPRGRIFVMLGFIYPDVRVEVDYGRSAEEIADIVLKRQLSYSLIYGNKCEP